MTEQDATVPPTGTAKVVPEPGADPQPYDPEIHGNPDLAGRGGNGNTGGSGSGGSGGSGSGGSGSGSNHGGSSRAGGPATADPDAAAESSLGAEDPPDEPADVGSPSASRPAGRDPEKGEDEDFGPPGPPINRNSPFYIGFFFALGGLIAWELLRLIGSLSGVLTLVGTAAFLAIGLDPVVRFLQRRGLRRGWAVAVVFIGVIGLFAGFIAAVLGAPTKTAGMNPAARHKAPQARQSPSCIMPPPLSRRPRPAAR